MPPLIFAIPGESLPVFMPQWIQGRVVEETCSRVGLSRVRINLPLLTADERKDYQEFEVEWRELGVENWQKVMALTTALSVNLTGELADGSYEVRVRGTGSLGQSLHMTALRFPLQCAGKWR